ncbi:MAG: M23 family metallopeptidase [Candidatus Omnitrophica bacterium]|nr:M23 family metallopeptidase [Candidatus Omnitrophota bacterium]
MRSFLLILSTAIITAVVTFFLYTPVSLLIFKITEPSFGYPIKSETGRMIIRNDVLGNGGFGAKRRGGRTHSGVDIAAKLNTPVYASKSGIAFRGNVPTGYGKYILIYHPDGTQTLYSHLFNWAVNTGKQIHKGDLIGFVGKTGNAANKKILAHLHFEIRSDGDPVDPTGAMR